MRCHVLLFAMLREEAGRERLTLDLPEGSTVAAALDRACAVEPAIAAWRGRIAFAVNARYASLDAPLSEGCEVALIPPVSGG